MEEAFVEIGGYQLRGGDFVIEMIEYFLSVLAVDPGAIILISDFSLLGFGPERAVTALSLFGFVHLI